MLIQFRCFEQANIRSYYNIPRKCLGAIFPNYDIYLVCDITEFRHHCSTRCFAERTNVDICVATSLYATPDTTNGSLAVIVVKYCFIGEIVEGDYPLYSLNYFRWWLLQRLAINPLYIPGHSLAVISSRFFGSKIGDNVYLGCTLFVESDLVEIGDNVTFQTDSVLQTWIIENRILKLRKIKIGNNVYVGERSYIIR